MVEQSKIVETKQLHIHCNTFIYDDSIIQMENISRISVAPMEKKKIPTWAIICVILGVVVMSMNVLMGVGIICVGGIYSAHILIENLSLGHYLTLELNSGRILYFPGKDEAFLNRIMRVMGDCMNDRNTGYTINMGQATITNMQIGDDNIIV